MGLKLRKLLNLLLSIKGPCYIRLGRSSVPDLFSADYKFELGKAVTVQEGTDVTIIATGIMVAEAKVAARNFGSRGDFS